MCARPRFRDVLTHVRTVRPDISDPLAAIEERRLTVDGVIVTNPSSLVSADGRVVVRPQRPLAGRRKLDAALGAIRLNVSGAICVDLGAAAGGFTSSLLGHGAGRVYAVDVGFGQLRGSLRSDPRVVNLERTNLADIARHISAEERIDVLTVDLSFLSLANALPQVRGLPFVAGASLLALVKPQFELGLSGPPATSAMADVAFRRACMGAIDAVASARRHAVTGSRRSRRAGVLLVRSPVVPADTFLDRDRGHPSNIRGTPGSGGTLGSPRRPPVVDAEGVAIVLWVQIRLVGSGGHAYRIGFRATSLRG